ncbi:hypothetical protein [Pseudogracilibacillus sp. SO30301A]|uniref:hypothetical protein n=1 Tax=Pseudogracilibacillus sp. SO30301A TaxID=3098291 RepID=UPI00300E2C0E
MKKNKKKRIKIIGYILFLFAIAFFCLQMGYLLVHAKYQVEYADNRLFYFINIICVLCLLLSILLIFNFTKTFKLLASSMIGLFIIGNILLLIISNNQVNNIISISPSFKNVLSIKEKVDSGDAVYYRVHYGILARPKEKLPYETVGEFNVEWLANDVAAVTYKAKNNTIQQFIGTYGDRGNGISYYYVGAEINGQWQADNAEVISNTEGISVTTNGKTELFKWENIVQYGTLAVVLKENDEAVWTISLNENFEVQSDASQPTEGNISLYRAALEEKQLPIILQYKGRDY